MKINFIYLIILLFQITILKINQIEYKKIMKI